ncbi:MAG: MATE family efflux transporter [Thermaerobacterales bacterium]
MRLAIPAVGENIAWSVGQTLLLIIAGLIGPAAIAGVGITEMLRWAILAFSKAIGYSVVAVVSRRIGEDRPGEARLFACQAVTATAVIMGLAAGAAALNSHWILTVMGAAPEVVELSLPYTRLAFLSIIFQALNFVLGSILKASGNTRTPMAAMALKSLTQVSLGYTLAHGLAGLPAGGMQGLGLAVLSGWAAGCLVITRNLYTHFGLFRAGNWRQFVPRWALLKRLVILAVPAGVEELSIAAGQLLFTRILTSLGTAVFAAHMIGFNMSVYGHNVAIGISVASGTLVGQSLGAGNPSLAHRYGLWCTALGAGIITAYAITLWAVAGSFAGLYTQDSLVIEAFRQAAPLISVALPGFGLFTILAAGLRGAGDTRSPMTATITSLWLFRLGASYFFGIVLGWGLIGVWAGWAIDQWGRGFWVLNRFLAGKWKQLRV